MKLLALHRLAEEVEICLQRTLIRVLCPVTFMGFPFSSICRGSALQEWVLPGVCAITHTQPWGPSRGRGSPYSHSRFWSRYALGKFYSCLCFSKSSPSGAGYLRSTAFLRRPILGSCFCNTGTKSFMGIQCPWALAVPSWADL